MDAMASGHKTGGRQKGTPNKATVRLATKLAEAAEQASAELSSSEIASMLPLDVMLLAMRRYDAILATLVLNPRICRIRGTKPSCTSSKFLGRPASHLVPSDAGEHVLPLAVGLIGMPRHFSKEALKRINSRTTKRSSGNKK
jgi:hypothetical protein